MLPDSRPRLDRWFERHFDDQEPAGLGSGWLSGTAAVFLGALSLGGVACLRFPDLLTSPMVREVYALSWIRPLLATVIGAAFALGLLSALVSHLLVQISAWLTLAPASAATRLPLWPDLQATVAALPWIVQFGAVILLADLGEYLIHRAFHRVSWLWPFHAIHHSSKSIDWLAGSRLHLVDVVITRGFTFVPIALLGFADGPVYAYLVFVSFHAVFIHANVRFPFTHVEDWVVTPRFHHWHHSAQAEAIDKNFAVHLPWIDRLFGTHYFPKGQWPSRYGLGHDHVPDSYLTHFVWPFRRR